MCWIFLHLHFINTVTAIDKVIPLAVSQSIHLSRKDKSNIHSH